MYIINFPPETWTSGIHKVPCQSEIVCVTGGLIVLMFLTTSVIMTHLLNFFKSGAGE